MRPPAGRARRARLGRGSAASRRVLPGDGCPEHREVWVEVERAPAPTLRLCAVAEATLDHPAVEELGCVERAEPERALREPQRLIAAAVPRERPGQHVVTVDRGTIAVRSARE